MRYFTPNEKFEIKTKTKYEKLPFEQGCYQVVFIEGHRGYTYVYCLKMESYRFDSVDRLIKFKDTELDELLTDGYLIEHIKN